MKHFISGHEFYKLCKWSYCPRYPMNFDPNNVQTNDFVFLNLDLFSEFVEKLSQSSIANKLILFTHNSDAKFTLNHLNMLRPYVNHVYAINSNVQDPLVTAIPIGFVDSQYKPHDKFVLVANKNLEKTILCYMNFRIGTNVMKRQECYNTFVHESWVHNESNLPPEVFYDQLSRAKYVLSPEGTGIDCHRIYESIYLGAIPILKTSELDYFYCNLPVVIVKNWNEITHEFLETNYFDFKTKLDQWVKENPTWTDANFWVKSVHQGV